MTHPCADHYATCDHCYQCDVLGICCASTRTPAAAQPIDLPDDDLIEAFARDAHVGHPLRRAMELDQLRHRLVEVSPVEGSSLLHAFALEEGKRSRAPQRALPAGMTPELEPTTTTPEETTHAHR